MPAENIRLAGEEAFERALLKSPEAQETVNEYKHYLEAEAAPKVESAYDRYTLARLLQSTEKVLTAEALQTTTVYGNNYVKAMLGMARQVYPRLFGTQLVSVQAMDRPTGQIFWLSTQRDDGSTLGRFAKDDQSTVNAAAYQASRDYANHTTGEGGQIQKGMGLTITSSNIAITKVKKLKVSASWELTTDLAAYHNLNALDLLQGAAVDEIAQEIDADILYNVRAAAIANHTTTFGRTPATGYTAETWGKRLQRAIINAEMAIFRKSGRRPNVMVVGLGAFTEMLDLSTFQMLPDANIEGGSYGVLTPVGVLNKQYTVLLSRVIPDNEILLGRKGAGFLDAGIVYAPYVSLFITDRFFDVDTQKTSQSFASRYEIFTQSNTLFSRVVIDETATGIS